MHKNNQRKAILRIFPYFLNISSSITVFILRKSLAEHQAMSSEMDKEKREMELAIARSVVDHQRLEIEKKSQEDLMEQQMKKLSMSSPTPGNL